MIANSRNQVLGRNDDVFNGMVNLLVDARSGRPKRRTSVPVRHTRRTGLVDRSIFFRRIANARTRRIRLEPLGPREKVIEIRIPSPESVVWGLQPLEHREVLHVARSETGPELLGCGRDDEIGTADPRMARPPPAPELPGSPRDGFINRDPPKLLEETLRRDSLSAA